MSPPFTISSLVQKLRTWCYGPPAPVMHLLLGGGGVLINWPIMLLKERSQKIILLPTLFQHGCLLINFLANLKLLKGRDTPTPPIRTSRPKILKSLASFNNMLFSRLLTDSETSKSDFHQLTIHKLLIRFVKLQNLLDFIMLFYYFIEHIEFIQERSSKFWVSLEILFDTLLRILVFNDCVFYTSF